MTKVNYFCSRKNKICTIVVESSNVANTMTLLKMNKPTIQISDYNYELPEEKIAKFPVNERSESKLLIYNGSIKETTFNQIPYLIPTNSLVVFNNTKVIRARIQFQKATGAKIEIFCLEPDIPVDINLAFQAKGNCSWKCIIGNSKKWKDGKLSKQVKTGKNELTLNIEKGNSNDETQIIKFNWHNEDVSFGDIMDAIGNIPIPPYLKRKSEEIDTERYQTVYSKHKGSVAAPTAGLHFTPGILSKFTDKNIKTANITLHVGAGTFKPVKSECISDHDMHIEHFFVDYNTICLLIENEGNITSTGTTTVRTLESLYWLGVKLIEKTDDFYINQWDPYNLPQHYSFSDSLKKLKEYMEQNEKILLESYTGILIAPGYEFRVVDRLITNFHQPNSTLLLLISAFTKGDNWKKIYNYALNNNFRFLSYGDSSLLYKG